MSEEIDCDVYPVGRDMRVGGWVEWVDVGRKGGERRGGWEWVGDSHELFVHR